MTVVLVTGGAGYIGSHACKALSAAGYEPVVFDNLSTGWRGAVRWGPLVEGDLLDRDSLARAFEVYRPEGVIHFAALSDVAQSVHRPDLYWRNNVAGSLNLMTAARDHGIRAFVFSSTCATFGEPTGEELTEAEPQVPITAYGQTKLAAERMLAEFYGSFGLHYFIFRYFNAAGADPAREIGEDHRPETHLVPLVLEAASGRQEAITIYGTDWPTPDGTCIRDFIHVADLAEAHVLGLEWLFDRGRPLALNLGSGSGHSVRSVIETARTVTGADIRVIEGARRAGDPARLVSGSELAASVLGWRPSRSALETMIADAWGWCQGGGFAA